MTLGESFARRITPLGQRLREVAALSALRLGEQQHMPQVDIADHQRSRVLALLVEFALRGAPLPCLFLGLGWEPQPRAGKLSAEQESVIAAVEAQEFVAPLQPKTAALSRDVQSPNKSAPVTCYKPGLLPTAADRSTIR